MPGGAGRGSGRRGSAGTADAPASAPRTAPEAAAGARLNPLASCARRRRRWRGPGRGGGGQEGNAGPPWREKGEGRGAGGGGGTSGLGPPSPPLPPEPSRAGAERGRAGEGHATRTRCLEPRVQGRADRAHFQGRDSAVREAPGGGTQPPATGDIPSTPIQSARAGKGRSGHSDRAPRPRDNPPPRTPGGGAHTPPLPGIYGGGGRAHRPQATGGAGPPAPAGCKTHTRDGTGRHRKGRAGQGRAGRRLGHTAHTPQRIPGAQEVEKEGRGSSGQDS